jgi:hypothetical protein
MPHGFFDVRQNDDSTGEGIVSDDIGLSFVYLMCLSFLAFLSCFIFVLFMHFVELSHASHILIF